MEQASSVLKERLINEMRTVMVNHMSAECVEIMSYSLAKLLNNINMSTLNYELSTELMNNNYLAKSFLASKKLEGKSINTLKAYSYSINKLFTFTNNNLIDMETNNLRIFLKTYAETVSQVSVDNMRRNLNSFFQWLEDENYIEKNPCKKIKKVKYEQKIRKPLSNIEVEKIRDACSDHEGRELALIDLFISTGIRCEETTKIMITDCDFENQMIKIHGKGAKERIVYMTDRCKLHLLEHLNRREYSSAYLFCKNTGGHDKLSTECLAQIMRSMGEKAGVENCQIHRFRKYFANTLFGRGCDIIYVQRLLGHSKLDTTKNHYLSITEQKVQNEFKRFIA